jgi:7,8-dihydropterin-6-yl-methyl-4-(beta-D-ribofuranosyl)aminobenzene 5'-phosphate synthase
MIKFTFLSENKTDNPGCMAEHGLSIYIEADGKKILFDAGASDLLISNAKKLKVDLSQVEDLIISHGHYDHTEGVPAFCTINNSAHIYIHKEAFHETYGMEAGVMDEEPCSILWNEAQKEEILKRSILTEGVIKLSEDIVISGTIPDVEGIEPTEKFFAKDQLADGSSQMVPDAMNHEQFLIIRDRAANGQSNGLYVFSGCSHKGVIPVLRYTKNLFPDEKVTGLIAGMHLYSADVDVRTKVVKEILDENVGLVMPVHCTGIKAICDLKAAMGEGCVVATAGDTYEF